MGIDCMHFFIANCRGAPRQRDGGLAFPTADFDDGTGASSELPKLIKAIHLGAGYQSG